MKKTILFIAAAAALVACQKAEVTTPSVNRAVKFEMTNLYSFDTKTEIASGGIVGIYASDPINASNIGYTVNAMPTNQTSGTFSGTTIEWGIQQIGTTTPSTFFAMYPWASSPERDAFSATSPLSYTIDNEEYAKDFLVAVTTQNPGTDAENPNPVSFNFQHPFALLRYVITNTSDDAIRSVTIAGVHKTGSLAYATAAVTATGDAATAAPLALESSNGNVHTYYSVIVPENTINPTLTITTWTGATSTYSLSAATSFVAGNVYTASITYNHTHGVSTSNRTMTANFTVAEWPTTGEDFHSVGDGVEAGYTSSTTTWPILKGVDFGSSWEQGLRMACVGENSYRLVITTTSNAVNIKAFTENNTWFGFGSKETFTSGDNEGWTKIVTDTDGNSANISATNVPVLATAGTYTVYFYYQNNNAPAEIWIKAGNVTR